MPLDEQKEAPRTRLSEEEILKLSRHVQNYLLKHPDINNRTLRAISGINYDQAIQFFNCMVERGQLQREGKSSGIKYTPTNRAAKTS
jgi:predicted HTH transcriptional regulator